MLVTKQLLVPLTLIVFFSSIQWKSMATGNCLFNILQNIFFCVYGIQKNEIHTGLEQLEGE